MAPTTLRVFRNTANQRTHRCFASVARAAPGAEREASSPWHIRRWRGVEMVNYEART